MATDKPTAPATQQSPINVTERADLSTINPPAYSLDGLLIGR
jgi:hypothetical protein